MSGMRITAESWRRSAAIYRALVAAQTIAWAATAAARVVSRPPRASPAVDRDGIGIALAAGAALAGGLLVYYRAHGRRGARTRPAGHEAVLVTWAWFQGAGLLALAGYAFTGAAACFVAEVVALAAMHAFSPNRLPGPGEA